MMTVKRPTWSKVAKDMGACLSKALYSNNLHIDMTHKHAAIVCDVARIKTQLHTCLTIEVENLRPCLYKQRVATHPCLSVDLSAFESGKIFFANGQIRILSRGIINDEGGLKAYLDLAKTVVDLIEKP